MPAKQINWTVFGEIQTATNYNMYRVFNAFPLNLTSIRQSPQNSNRHVGIHHCPNTIVYPRESPYPRQPWITECIAPTCCGLVVGYSLLYNRSTVDVQDFIPLSLSTGLNSFLTIFHPNRCVLPIQISLPDQPVLLATFPLGPFLCLHLLLGTIYPHTFVLSIPYPPLNAT